MEYKLFLWVSHAPLNTLQETGADILLLSWNLYEATPILTISIF